MKQPKQTNSQGQKADSWLSGAGVKGQWGVIINGDGASYWDEENVKNRSW